MVICVSNARGDPTRPLHDVSSFRSDLLQLAKAGSNSVVHRGTAALTSQMGRTLSKLRRSSVRKTLTMDTHTTSLNQRMLGNSVQIRGAFEEMRPLWSCLRSRLFYTSNSHRGDERVTRCHRLT